MAITKKPAVDVDALIERGGKPPQRDGKEPKQVVDLHLRLPTAIVTDLDGLLYRRRLRMSRHTFILQAIDEKIERERARYA